MNRLMKWAGGILTPVLIAYLGWYLTRPPVPTTFEGMVIDQTKMAPVQNAMVSVSIKSAELAGEFHNLTDEHGSYRFDFDSLDKNTPVRMNVQANGFQAAPTASIGHLAITNRQDFLLTEIPVIAPGEVHPPAVINPTAAKPPIFVPKMMQERVNLKALRKQQVLMTVVRADSPEEAKNIVDGDPFMPTGLVTSEIHPAYLEDLSGVKFEYPAATTK